MTTTTSVLMPKVNEQIFKVVMETCRDAVYAMPEYHEYEALSELVLEKMEGLVDKETYSKIQDLVSEVAWLMGTEMFQMGFAIGRDGNAVFDLPLSSQTWQV